MIYKTLAIALVLIVNACSTADTDLDTSIEEMANLQTKISEDEALPYVYLEELHYMSLITEFGEEHPLIPVYREKFEGLIAGVKPGSGCPTPKPCDGGGTGNCKAFMYQELVGMFSFGEMGDLTINIYNNNGQLMNEISNIEATKCPQPKSSFYNLAEPLAGNGYFEISFVSEFTEGEMVGFKVPFIQE